MDLVLNNIFNTIFIEKMIWATFVSTGFAILFTTPRRALWATGLLGAVGFSTKYILLHSVLIDHIVVSSFIAAMVVGILGMYFAHRVHTPPVVFTIPAVINMVPGKLGYEFMIGLIKMVSFEREFDITLPFVYETMNKGLKTGFIMFVLALGVTTPILIFNTYSVKDKDLHDILKRRKQRLLKQKNSNT